jgi:hypothetical protein
MQQTVVLAGATDQSVLVRADTISTGTPNTSLTHASSGLEIRYKRGATGAVTTVTPVTQTSTGAHSDGGFVHLHGGVYRVDLPDAAFAAAAPWVVITLAGVTDVRFTVATVDLSAGDPRAEFVQADVARWRGTQPNVLVSNRVDTSVGAMAANVMTAAAAAADLTTELQSGLATAAALTTVDNEIAVIDTNVDTLISRVTAAVATAAALTTVDNEIAVIDGIVDTLLARVTAEVATASALATVDTEIGVIDGLVDSIKAKTDSLTFTVANVVDANVQRINDVTITGDGSVGDKFDVV